MKINKEAAPSYLEQMKLNRQLRENNNKQPPVTHIQINWNEMKRKQKQKKQCLKYALSWRWSPFGCVIHDIHFNVIVGGFTL